MKIKEIIENHPVMIFLGALLAGFLAGWNAYEVVLKISQKVIVSEETQKKWIETDKELVEVRYLNQKLNATLTLYNNHLNCTISGFNSGHYEGWIATYMTGNYKNDGGSSMTKGDGYIESHDQLNDGRASYFVAPSHFLGDWREVKELKFSLYSDGGKDSSGSDVVLMNEKMSAKFSFSRRPGKNWETFLIPLNENVNEKGKWTLEGGTFQEILKNITRFEIRAEYGEGDDWAGLDDVTLIYNTPKKDMD